MSYDETRVDQAELGVDVFAAAEWFDSCWNSSARAVAADLIEWRCLTWGSGRGRAAWIDTATFNVVAAALGLTTGRHLDGRDELIVFVPLNRVSETVELVTRLGEDPESWPWFNDEAVEGWEEQVELAATTLHLPRSAVAANEDLLKALRVG